MSAALLDQGFSSTQIKKLAEVLFYIVMGLAHRSISWNSTSKRAKCYWQQGGRTAKIVRKLRVGKLLLLLVPKPADTLVSALLASHEVWGVIFFPENLKSLAFSRFSKVVRFYVWTWVETEVSGEICSYLSAWCNAFWELHLHSLACVCVCIYRRFFTCLFLLKETVIRDLKIL